MSAQRKLMVLAGLALLAMAVSVSAVRVQPAAAAPGQPATAAVAAAAAAQTAATTASTQSAAAAPNEELLQGSSITEQNGWMLVRLAGTPYQIGYQRGYLTATYADYWVRSYLGPKGSSWRRMSRGIAKKYVWAKIPAEYKAELRGNVAGMRAKGSKVDIWDLVAANQWADQYVWEKAYAKSSSGRCSAFIATGDATADGKIVMGHNTWSNYDGDFMYSIIFDVHPAKGHAFRYQGSGGSIWSGEDWYVNAAGLMVCETTIDGDEVVNPKGIPVFVRIRRAVQYGDSIDDFLAIMLRKNNGGYANQWLVGDAKTGEIASLQLGCKAYDLERTTNGFIGSSNFPYGPNFRKEATHEPKHNLKHFGYARYVRWGQLKTQWYGKVTAEVGKTMLADHYDTYTQKEGAGARTLCGHCEDEVADPTWVMPMGAYDGKVTTSDMALNGMQMWARWGHPCGEDFDAEQFMLDNPSWVRQNDAFAILGLLRFDAATPNAWTVVGDF